MTEMFFDTQKNVDRLVDAGVPAAQARAHVSVLADVIASVDGRASQSYASKDSVALAIEKFEKRIEELRSDITNRMITIGILETAIITLIVILVR